VGRLLLTEDLTRWADATARLFVETDAREDAAHLESLWVLEDADRFDANPRREDLDKPNNPHQH
jgi:hypothetical protein